MDHSTKIFRNTINTIIQCWNTINEQNIRPGTVNANLYTVGTDKKNYNICAVLLCRM
jgi:hypothetical protein